MLTFMYVLCIKLTSSLFPHSDVSFNRITSLSAVAFAGLASLETLFGQCIELFCTCKDCTLDTCNPIRYPSYQLSSSASNFRSHDCSICAALFLKNRSFNICSNISANAIQSLDNETFKAAAALQSL